MDEVRAHPYPSWYVRVQRSLWTKVVGLTAIGAVGFLFFRALDRSDSLAAFLWGQALFALLGGFLALRLASSQSTPGRVRSYGRTAVFGSLSLFFLLNAGTILDLHRSLYAPSFWFFLLTSLAGIVIVFQVLWNLPLPRGLVLFEILVVGIVVRYALPLINPLLVGNDTYSGYFLYQEMQALGFISPDAGYYFYWGSSNAFNLVSGTLLQLSFPGEGWGWFLVGIPMVALFALGTYAFVNRFFGSRAALLSALFFTLFSGIVAGSRTGGYTPVYTALSLFPLVLLLATVRRSAIPLGLLAVAIFFSHPFVSLSLVIAFAAVKLPHYIAVHWRGVSKSQSGVPLAPAVAYGVAWLSFLLYVYSPLFSNILSGIFNFETNIASPYALAVFTPQASFLVSFQAFLGSLGIAMLLFLASFAAVRWIGSGSITYQRALVLGLIAFPALFTLVVVGLRAYDLQPSRILPIIGTFLPLAAGPGVLMIAAGSRHRAKLAALAFTGILLYASVSSHLTGMRNPLWEPDVPLTQPLIQQSSAAINSFLFRLPPDAQLMVDPDILSRVLSPNRGLYGPQSWIALTGNTPSQLSYPPSTSINVVILSLDNFRNGVGGSSLTPVLLAALEDAGAARMYDNGNIVLLGW